MDLDLDSLVSSVSALERACGITTDMAQWQGLSPTVQEVIKSGVIQCFEVAYEQSWKMMQRWLEVNRSPSELTGATRRHLYRLSAEEGLIDDVDAWMTFNKARNQTSHTYDHTVAQAVFETASAFLVSATLLVKRLQEAP
jgi:nucleotidyltransferase substrate binding protein (TIGR01987 family)